MKPPVLVTKFIYPAAIDYLREHAEVEYYDARQSMPPDDLLERCRGKQGVICQLTDKFRADVIAQLDDSVKVLSNVAVGYDNIDVPAAAERGITVTNTPGVLTETTADLAFALIMAAGRRLTEAERFLRSGQWGEWYVDHLCGYDIHGATLGLLGMGRIGQAVARRAQGFGMRTLYHDAIRQPEATERELGVTYASQDEVLAQSDFVSLHVPLTPETRHLIGAAELAKMKPTAVLVNTSRGPVVDEPALAEALKAGTIAAAGIDVFEQEPKVHPGLLELDNVALTPHIASASVATRTKMSMIAAENCVAVLEGREPANPVKP